MLNMSASRLESIRVILLAASMMRPCRLGVCVTLSNGFTLSKYICQSLNICTGSGCKVERSIGVLRDPNRRWSSFLID